MGKRLLEMNAVNSVFEYSIILDLPKGFSAVEYNGKASEKYKAVFGS